MDTKILNVGIDMTSLVQDYGDEFFGRCTIEYVDNTYSCHWFTFNRATHIVSIHLKDREIPYVEIASAEEILQENCVTNLSNIEENARTLKDGETFDSLERRVCKDIWYIFPNAKPDATMTVMITDTYDNDFSIAEITITDVECNEWMKHDYKSNDPTDPLYVLASDVAHELGYILVSELGK